MPMAARPGELKFARIAAGGESPFDRVADSMAAGFDVAMIAHRCSNTVPGPVLAVDWHRPLQPRHRWPASSPVMPRHSPHLHRRRFGRFPSITHGSDCVAECVMARNAMLMRKHIAHNLIRRASSADSLRMRRNVVAWDDNFLASLVTA